MTDSGDLNQYSVFREAVQALDTGEIERLETMLDEHPWLVRYGFAQKVCLSLRSRREHKA